MRGSSPGLRAVALLLAVSGPAAVGGPAAVAAASAPATAAVAAGTAASLTGGTTGTAAGHAGDLLGTTRRPAEPAGAASTSGPTGTSAALRRPPVDGAVSRPFVAPVHEYGPGHRGVDLAAPAGQVVRSPAAGTVTFAGQVAGRGVVVVEHAAGTLTSLEPVTATSPRGSPVAAGSPVAVVEPAGDHAGCGCVHWGVRVAGRYVDPMWWLGGGRAVRLLPLVGPR